MNRHLCEIFGAATSVTFTGVSFTATHPWIQDVAAFIAFSAGLVTIVSGIKNLMK